jgi:hypothetical protein
MCPKNPKIEPLIIKNFDKIVFKCYSKFFNHYFLKMKNTTNTLNKLTKLLAVAIISVSLKTVEAFA